MSRMKVGIAAGCLVVFLGGVARAQGPGVVPGGWDVEFGAQPFPGGGPGGPATPGPGFGTRTSGFDPGRRAGMPRLSGATPLTGDALGGLARTIERTAFRRRGR